jgi:hypothetical protein
MTVGLGAITYVVGAIGALMELRDSNRLVGTFFQQFLSSPFCFAALMSHTLTILDKVIGAEFRCLGGITRIACGT